MLELLWFSKAILPGFIFNFFLEKLLLQFWEVASVEEKTSIELLRDSERGVILESIFRGVPLKKILEVGCGCGQNFWFLKRLLPNTPLTGVERDKSLFVEGERLVNQLKLKNINFVPATPTNKLPFEDKSFDLSYTCAALLYTDAHQIEFVIAEMIRVTKFRIVLLEQHKVDPGYSEQNLGVWVSKLNGSGGYWIRDYEKLLSKFVQVKSVKMSKVKKPRFLGESWQETAFLIEAELS